MQKISSQSFYDIIAPDYNQHLETNDNKLVREKIRFIFKQMLKAGKVLDFGGGTGLDLKWLLSANYEVFFCEPADKMRNQAVEFVKDLPNQPFFINAEKSDFHAWTAQTLPFSEKMDGILANFAVFNCIDDIELMFEKLELITTPQAQIFACVIDARPRNLFKSYFKNALKAYLTGQKIKTSSAYKGVGHETYLYTINYLKKASSKYFELVDYQPLGGFGFLLVHFCKK